MKSKKKEAVVRAGQYTAYKVFNPGPYDRQFWIEGPSLSGGMVILARCWDEGDAIRLIKELAKTNTVQRLIIEEIWVEEKY